MAAAPPQPMNIAALNAHAQMPNQNNDPGNAFAWILHHRVGLTTKPN